ncbi:hypothetical protein [Metabacillus iocasae]|uniref:DUF4871 domain-containing protein n=1 Tax=Priestia iocasae TaxID=2291674 RepID=A0ABS2QTR1_9BACI|nr:hypothetical protein [Metabacillus iocasae]MBM7702151.1 hypothetical protein [Metabacillus iocasae]
MKKRWVFLLALFLLTSCSNQVNHSTVESPDNLPNFFNEQDLEKIDWNKQAKILENKNMIGNENKLGVIGANMPSLNGQKWMWHLWGIQPKELTIIGFHKETNTIYPILKDEQWTIEMAGALNGADAHKPSSVEIPQKGEWAFLTYTDGKLFDILVHHIEH